MHMVKSSRSLVIYRGLDRHDSLDKMEILVGSHMLENQVFWVVDTVVWRLSRSHLNY